MESVPAETKEKPRLKAGLLILSKLLLKLLSKRSPNPRQLRFPLLS